MNIVHGDCLEVMRGMADNSVDSIVTDPPYGLSFMGKKWDYDVPSVDVWRECLRVLKPGGHLLSFAGTRTQHRMAVNIEDAGFEIRDMIAWVYGSGFPKSLNIGKVMDKFIKTGNASWNGTGDSSNGALGYSKLQHQQGYRPADYSNKHQDKSEITEDKAKEWEGWGTALKPALEPITVARKPIEKGLSVAENCLKWGVGGMNIDGCRIPTEEDQRRPSAGGDNGLIGTSTFKIHERKTEDQIKHQGRWPANLIHDGSDEVKELFPETKSGSINGTYNNTIMAQSNGDRNGKPIHLEFNGDSGSAARFFYCAKASRSERNAGLEGMPEKRPDERTNTGMGTFVEKGVAKQSNHHPTVKPIKLMRYLCRLVTPPGGIVLDPFAGSGSTGKACALEGFRFIGIEREMEYCKIAEARIASVDVGLFGAAL